MLLGILLVGECRVHGMVGCGQVYDQSSNWPPAVHWVCRDSQWRAVLSGRGRSGSAVLLLGRALLSSRINIVLVGSSSQQAPANHMSTSGGWWGGQWDTVRDSDNIPPPEECLALVSETFYLRHDRNVTENISRKYLQTNTILFITIWCWTIHRDVTATQIGWIKSDFK